MAIKYPEVSLSSLDTFHKFYTQWENDREWIGLNVVSKVRVVEGEIEIYSLSIQIHSPIITFHPNDSITISFHHGSFHIRKTFTDPKEACTFINSVCGLTEAGFKIYYEKLVRDGDKDAFFDNYARE